MQHTLRVSSLTAFLLVVLFSAPFVFAQETEESAPAPAPVGAPLPPERPLDAIKARAQQMKQNAQNLPGGVRRDSATGTRPMNGDMMRERVASTTNGARGIKALVLMHGGQIKNRFRLAITHMQNLMERIETRIAKMAAAGVDTSNVTALKEKAEAAIAKAEADAKAVSDYVASVNESSERTSVRTELQAKIATAQESMKAAHTAMRDLVKSLVTLAKNNKGASGSSTEGASSTTNTVQ